MLYTKLSAYIVQKSQNIGFFALHVRTRSALAAVEYDDYDRLIQLCDSMAGAEGVMAMEDRMSDVFSICQYLYLTPKYMHKSRKF